MLILDHYGSRKRQSEEKSGGGESLPYMPVAPDLLYMDSEAVEHAGAGRAHFHLSAFHTPPTARTVIIDAGGSKGRSFSTERQDNASSVFDAAVSHIGDIRKAVAFANSVGGLDKALALLQILKVAKEVQ